jgi:hypothetical protein
MSAPSDRAIILAWARTGSVTDLLLEFDAARTPTSSSHIEKVWRDARARGDLPPLERPENGFNYEQSEALTGLLEKLHAPSLAHDKTRREQGGSSV